MITQNTKLNKLIDQEYIELVKSVLERIINSDDAKKAFELFSLLEKAVAKHKNEIEKFKEIDDFYQKTIIKLKFIALPLLYNADVEDLVKNYFTWQFRIPYYDFLKKFNNKLINIEVFEERDNLKENLKNALLNSELVITSKFSIKKMNEWLRDYVSKLGIKIVDNLKRTQYLTNLKNTKELNDYDYQKLKLLFDFYEKLKLSSVTPQGFEEDMPIVIDDKFYIFKQGVLNPIGEKATKTRIITGPPKTQSEKKIDELKQEEKQYAEGGLEEKALEEEIGKEKEIENLQYMADKYPKGSLERKAVRDEIDKIKGMK